MAGVKLRNSFCVILWSSRRRTRTSYRSSSKLAAEFIAVCCIACGPDGDECRSNLLGRKQTSTRHYIRSMSHLVMISPCAMTCGIGAARAPAFQTKPRTCSRLHQAAIPDNRRSTQATRRAPSRQIRAASSDDSAPAPMSVDEAAALLEVGMDATFDEIVAAKNAKLGAGMDETKVGCLAPWMRIQRLRQETCLPRCKTMDRMYFFPPAWNHECSCFPQLPSPLEGTYF